MNLLSEERREAVHKIGNVGLAIVDTLSTEEFDEVVQVNEFQVWLLTMLKDQLVKQLIWSESQSPMLLVHDGIAESDQVDQHEGLTSAKGPGVLLP